MEKKDPSHSERTQNKLNKLFAGLGRVLRREKPAESTPESMAEGKAREAINLFALAETQLPKRTLLANEQNAIDLLKEPSGTIYRFRIDSREGFFDHNDPDDFAPSFLISYKYDGEMYFFGFGCRKRFGSKKEFHVAPQDLSSIEVWKEKPKRTDFKISELEEVFPILKFMEATPKGVDIMQFGTPAKNRQKQGIEQTQESFGSIPGVVGA